MNSLKKLSFLVVASLMGTYSASASVEVTFENDNQLPLVYINVAIKEGAATDPKGKAGITRFMGQMLLRGTKTKTKEQIDQTLDQIGASLGVETRHEAVILRGAVLKSELTPLLGLMTEVLSEPSFPDVEIKKLKKETDSDLLESLSSDQYLAAKNFDTFLFGDHPYGKQVVGTRKSVASFSRGDIVKQYEKLVRASLFLIIGTGDASSSDFAKFANTLSKLRPESTPVEEIPAAQPITARKLLIVDKPNRTQTQILVGHLGPELLNAHYFPLYVGNHAFGGGSFSARLMTEIRIKRGWSYGARSEFDFGLKPKSWSVMLFPASKYTPEALAHTVKMIEELKAKGITQDEFQFSKESLINSSGFRFDTPKKRVENMLFEKTMNLPEGFMKSYGDKISRVSLEEVNQAVAEFYQPSQLVMTVVATARELKPKLAKAAGVAEKSVVVRPYSQE